MAVAVHKFRAKQQAAAASGHVLRWQLTPTQGAFCTSDALLVGIGGPMGPGKSWAGAVAMSVHAKRNKLAHPDLEIMNAYVVRDTLENLRKSPIPTLEKVYGPYLEMKRSSKEGWIYTNPLIHLQFLGIADRGSLGKLQGPEVALIWLEERCPIADLRYY